MDIEKLKALALAAGSEKWNDDADDSAVVCDESGYAVCVCEATLGAIPTIFADQRAGFIAAANPASVLELIAEVERLRADAARYRWLRDKARLEYNERIFVTDDGHKDYYAPNSICESELDDAVDAAIEAHNARSPSCGP